MTLMVMVVHPQNSYFILKLTSFCAGSNGSITFNNISPGEYVVRVKAQNNKHDEDVLRRKVVVIGGSTLCGTHLINKGITQTGRNVTVEFTGTGPRAGFTCRLDREKSFSCKCNATYETATVYLNNSSYVKTDILSVSFIFTTKSSIRE